MNDVPLSAALLIDPMLHGLDLWTLKTTHCSPTWIGFSSENAWAWGGAHTSHAVQAGHRRRKSSSPIGWLHSPL